MEVRLENVMYNINERENMKYRFWEKRIELKFILKATWISKQKDTNNEGEAKL